MKNNLLELIEKFNEISKKRWIKGINNNSNSAGLTFEKLLGKKSDNMFFPDFQGIEIKTSLRFSRYPISLFTKSFDGPYLYQMNKLLIKYGISDYKFKDKKILISKLSCIEKTLVNFKYYFKLEVNEKEQKLYLEIYDKNNILIEKEAYIDFESLKTRLEIKLSNLAIVWASKKIINNNLYFRYYKMSIYKLISFEKFIELLKKDIIKADIVGRVSKSGTEIGRQRNKDLVFQLPKESITQLFEIMKVINNDLPSDFTIFN